MSVVSDNIGIASGSINSQTNQPFTYYATDEQVGAKTEDAVRDITKNMPMDITANVEDIDTNAYKLIEKLVINTEGVTIPNHTRSCLEVAAGDIVVGKTTNDDIPGDKKFKYDGLDSLLPGNMLCYDVHPVTKQSVFPATDTVQIKKARVQVMGDGSVLNSGIAYFIIPPRKEGSNE